MTTTERLLSAEVMKKNPFIEFREDIEEKHERNEAIDDLTLALNYVMYESEKRINRDFQINNKTKSLLFSLLFIS